MFTTGIAVELASKRITFYYFILEKPQVALHSALTSEGLRGSGRQERMHAHSLHRQEIDQTAARSCQLSPFPGTKVLRSKTLAF